MVKTIFRICIFALMLSLTSINTIFADDCKAVYYDKDYPVSWVSRSAAEEFTNFAAILGFKVMDVEALGQWMKGRVSEGAQNCLLIMAQDVAPLQIVEATPTPTALFRKYLDAGGSVIWFGDVPFYYVGKPGDEKITWDYLGGRGVLGIDTVGNWKGRSASHLTAEGEKLSLKTTCEGTRALPVKDVSTALALDADGNASSWIKSYRSGSPGFIRLWDCGVNAFTDSMGEDLYRIALQIFPKMQDEGFAKIYLFKESDHYPLIHNRDGRLTREILATVFYPQTGERKFFLKISDGAQTLQTVPLFSDDRSYFRKIVEVPLIHPDETIGIHLEKSGREIKVSESKLNEKDFFCWMRWTPEPTIHPIDLGYLLAPADSLIITPEQRLRVRAEAITLTGSTEQAVDKSIIWRITAVDSQNKTEILSKKTVHLPPNKFNTIETEISLASKKYKFVKSEFIYNNKTIYSEEKRIEIRQTRIQQRPFGAYRASIDYPAPVPVYDRAKEKWGEMKWEKMWRRGPHDDVVVHFPDGEKFVFWRGSGYVPFWASQFNIGLTYEWLEASAGRGGLVDCIEPLQDKECRYSRVEIISSSPARVVVRWRYALADLEYTIADDEWGEEIYTFYPDGFGIRRATGWFLPLTWHEANEFITLIPAGSNPFDIFPEKVVTILSLDGKKEEVAYPQPSGKWMQGTPAIFRINWHKDDKNTPVMVTRNFHHFIVQYDGWRVDGRYICPSYWGVHWPVTRGYPTTRGAPPGWRQRPGHASLMAIESESFEREIVSSRIENITWAWLIGNTDASDENLIKSVRNWIEPVKIKIISGAQSAEYDFYEKAYRVVTNGDSIISLQFQGAGGGKIANPAIIFPDIAMQKVKVKINGEELKEERYRYALEQTYDDDTGVLWIGAEIQDDSSVTIEFDK
ncbi:MAG: hypothetical protein AB1546_00270 [bacterium]